MACFSSIALGGLLCVASFATAIPIVATNTTGLHIHTTRPAVITPLFSYSTLDVHTEGKISVVAVPCHNYSAHSATARPTVVLPIKSSVSAVANTTRPLQLHCLGRPGSDWTASGLHSSLHVRDNVEKPDNRTRKMIETDSKAIIRRDTQVLDVDQDIDVAIHSKFEELLHLTSPEPTVVKRANDPSEERKHHGKDITAALKGLEKIANAVGQLAHGISAAVDEAIEENEREAQEAAAKIPPHTATSDRKLSARNITEEPENLTEALKSLGDRAEMYGQWIHLSIDEVDYATRGYALKSRDTDGQGHGNNTTTVYEYDFDTTTTVYPHRPESKPEPKPEPQPQPTPQPAPAPKKEAKKPSGALAGLLGDLDQIMEAAEQIGKGLSGMIDEIFEVEHENTKKAADRAIAAQKAREEAVARALGAEKAAVENAAASNPKPSLSARSFPSNSTSPSSPPFTLPPHLTYLLRLSPSAWHHLTPTQTLQIYQFLSSIYGAEMRRVREGNGLERGKGGLKHGEKSVEVAWLYDPGYNGWKYPEEELEKVREWMLWVAGGRFGGE